MSTFFLIENLFPFHKKKTFPNIAYFFGFWPLLGVECLWPMEGIGNGRGNNPIGVNGV